VGGRRDQPTLLISPFLRNIRIGLEINRGNRPRSLLRMQYHIEAGTESTCWV